MKNMATVVYRKSFLGVDAILREEALYLSKEGNYFICSKNGALSIVAEWHLLSSKPEKIIFRVTEEEAYAWTKEVAKQNLYELIAKKSKLAQ